jgi:AraC-like DNA-binding protein
MTELFRRFLDDQESGALDPTSAALLVMLMLCEVARSRPPSKTGESASTRLAGRADTYIRTHFHQPLTPSSLAAILGCNANYLSRIFHQVYERTLTATIQECRLRYARQLLLDDDRNIDEIARACGFRDTGYFRRLFKRYEGLSPLSFRRLYSRLHTNTL